MARYFAGNSLAAFYRNAPGTIEITTAGRFNSAFVPNAIALPVGNAGAFIRSWPFLANGQFVWYRFDFINAAGGIQSGDGARLMNGTTPVFRFAQTGNGIYQCQYWNTTTNAWVNTGSTISLPLSVLYTIVVKIEFGVGFVAYSSGTEVASGSGWTSGSMQATLFEAYPFATNGTGTNYSQIMVADYDLRDSHAMAASLNGNSAVNTAGTGSYTDVNEVLLDESTAVILAAAGKKGFTKSAITLPSGLGIGAFVISARGRVSGGAVSDGKLGVRSGGANYSSSGRGYNGGYEPRGHILEADPATSGAWGETSFNNAEPYVEAA